MSVNGIAKFLVLSVLMMSTMPTFSTGQVWQTPTAVVGDNPICEEGAVELVLVQPDGLDVARKRLQFAQPDDVWLDSSWEVGELNPGKYSVDAIVTGCDGGRTATHRIETMVTARDLRKTIGIYVSNRDGVLEVKYFAASTVLDGTGLFEATSGGFSAQFKYLGVEPIRPCRRQGHVTLKYMVDGDWNLTEASQTYHWTDGTSPVTTGGELPVLRRVIWVPGPRGSRREVAPTGKRLKVDVGPSVKKAYPETPQGTPILPWCDTFVATLPLQDGEPTFYLPPPELEAPNLEPVLESED